MVTEFLSLKSAAETLRGQRPSTSPKRETRIVAVRVIAVFALGMGRRRLCCRYNQSPISRCSGDGNIDKKGIVLVYNI